jgi:hypothetical protein
MMWLQETYSLRRLNRKYGNELRTLKPCGCAAVPLRRIAIPSLGPYGLPTGICSFLCQESGRLSTLPVDTDGVAHSLFSGGIRTRLGEQTRPSIDVFDGWIKIWTTNTDRLEPPCFNESMPLLVLTFLPFAWLAWLRSMEAFCLRWSYVSTIEPVHAGASADRLPYGWVAVTYIYPQTRN